MSEPFEIPFIVLTGTLAFTVGISVLVIKDASTHALDTEEPPTIRRITSSWEALANFALLIMLSLEVFRISIPDSQIANLTLAILNIVYGFTAIFNLYLWVLDNKKRIRRAARRSYILNRFITERSDGPAIEMSDDEAGAQQMKPRPPLKQKQKIL